MPGAAANRSPRRGPALPAARCHGHRGAHSPVSHDFCANCDRIRVTADGKLKGCLHSAGRISLRGLHGKELEDAIRQGISRSRSATTWSAGSDTPRNMNEIGG
ncbi:MAG: hypothetical protein V8R40_09370 [Dysosmobacter sp.]